MSRLRRPVGGFDTELLGVLGVQPLPAAGLHGLATNDAAYGSSAEKAIQNIETNVPLGDGGRLSHIHDTQNGDELYEYDPVNRLTSVLDAHHKPLLVNTYGYLGEIQSQTLADGRKLLYESGYDEGRRLDYLKLTLPNGYAIEWFLTHNGFTRSWPKGLRNIDAAQHR